MNTKAPSSTKEYKSAYWKKYRVLNRPYKIKICIVCGKTYTQNSNAQKRCNECQSIKCVKCGKMFIPNNHTMNHKYCSRQCKDNSLKGKEPDALKNNRGKKQRTYHLTKREKHGSAFEREWRINIFERDNYTCQICGTRGGKLNAHHIVPFKLDDTKRYDLQNGQTLCEPCHKNTDTYGWGTYWKKIRAAKRLAQKGKPW